MILTPQAAAYSDLREVAHYLRVTTDGTVRLIDYSIRAYRLELGLPNVLRDLEDEYDAAACRAALEGR